MKRLIQLSACFTIALTTALAPAADVDLRVTRVAIFSSGVAYYECEADVAGDATAELNFRTDQINDIIKSMVVQDLDGGTIGTIGYPSRDPIEKTLRSFGVDITGNPSLGELLDQLRGEEVAIAGDRACRGVILGVERQKLQVGAAGIVEVDVLSVLTDTGMLQMPIAQVQGVQLLDDKVDAELRKALQTLATAHDADKKSVTINFQGEGQRHVRVAYLLEAPIWKTTYRLVLDQDEKPFLQGWATVENATEEDWRDVGLSLVSGRPISFVMDLYSPIYIPRPEQELELYASLRPPGYAGAFAMEDKADLDEGTVERMSGRRTAMKAPARSMEESARLRALGYVAEAPMVAGGRGISAGFAAGDGVASVANAEEAGELFQYTIRMPISVPRQHSAMLPIVNEGITGSKVSIYNLQTHRKYPLNGLEIENTTDLNLMQGPVTLFDGDVYAGDAMLPDLKPGEKRLVGYALDLSTEVNLKQQPHPETLVSLRIHKGTLGYTNKQIAESEYLVKNKADRERTVLLEHAHGSDWKLIEPAKPYEEAPGLSRFKVVVPAQKTVKQVVKLERTLEQWVALSNIGLDQISYYLRSSVISENVKQALQRVAALRTELDRISRDKNRCEKEVAEQVAEQSRIRQNLQTLRQNSDVYNRQLEKFEQIEAKIEQFRTQLDELRTSEEQKRRELENYLSDLTID